MKKNTHKTEAADHESRVCVVLPKFSDEELDDYADAHDLGVGWITIQQRTGDWDLRIAAWLEQSEQREELAKLEADHRAEEEERRIRSEATRLEQEQRDAEEAEERQRQAEFRRAEAIALQAFRSWSLAERNIAPAAPGTGRLNGPCCWVLER